jgi:hypothetical protein
MKAQKENTTLKRSCERKKAIVPKIIKQTLFGSFEEYIRVFLFGLACRIKMHCAE